MRYYFCSAFFVLLFPVLACAQPSIHFETMKRDFGTVNQKDKVDFEFHFVNKGTEDLVIEKVVPS
jgi:hypothetical protein